MGFLATAASKAGLATGRILLVIGAVLVAAGIFSSPVSYGAFVGAAVFAIPGFLLVRSNAKRLGVAAVDTSPKSRDAAIKFLVVAGLAVLIIGGLAKISGDEASAPAAHEFDAADALTLCQRAITRAAFDPEKADVPWVEAKMAGSNFYFAWNRNSKLARMRNKLGLEVPVEAECLVDPTARQIVGLRLDGETVIGKK